MTDGAGQHGGKGRVTEILGKVRESLYSINEGSARIPIAGMRSGLGWVEDGTELCIHEEEGLGPRRRRVEGVPSRVGPISVWETE